MRFFQAIAFAISCVLFAGCTASGGLGGSGNTGGPVTLLPVALEYRFEKDTVRYGERVNIVLTWHNPTDSTLTFSSSARLLFAQPGDSREVYYGPEPSNFVIERELGGEATVTLPPGATFDQRLTAPIKPSSFTERATPYRLTVRTGIRKGEAGHVVVSANDYWLTVRRPGKN